MFNKRSKVAKLSIHDKIVKKWDNLQSLADIDYPYFTTVDNFKIQLTWDEDIDKECLSIDGMKHDNLQWIDSSFSRDA